MLQKRKANEVESAAMSPPLSGALIGLLLGLSLATSATADPITLTAADGVKVSGGLWLADGPRPPIILAFHQADSNKAEYAPMVERLNEAGFTLLAIDQRSGGDYYGGNNRTVEVLGASTGYDAAMPDLEAALAWGRDNARGAPVIVWGSSYSAALVFLLAAKYPNAIAGVLAFSPDEYLARKRAVRDAAAKLQVPVYITQATTRGEPERAHRIFRAVASEDKVEFIPAIRGTHGSSTLRSDTNPEGAEENWQALLKFLARFRKR